MRMPSSRKQLAAATSLSASLFIAGTVVGYSSISPVWARASLHIDGGSPLGSDFLAILLQNLSVVLFLFSGVVTLGLTSVVSLALVSVYVGATFAVGTANGGLAAVLTTTGPYAGLEFLAVVLAGAAGLCPVLALLGRGLQRDACGPGLQTYVSAVRTSLATLVVSALLVLLAASIEAVVIASR